MEKRTDRPSRLSAAFVRDVTEAGRYSDGPGSYGLSLFVRWGARGLTRHFQQRITLNGKRTNIAIGKWPLVTLAEARDAAFANARSVHRGGLVALTPTMATVADVSESPAPAPVSLLPTFSDLAEVVIAANAQAWRGKRTMDGWRTRLETYAFPLLGDRRIDSITTADVLDVLEPVWVAKHATAVKLAESLRRVFATAIGRGFRPDNPADSAVLDTILPRVGRTVKHHAALGHEDLANAIIALRESNAPDGHKLAIEWIALTCVRSGEARAATWDEVDPDAREWVIPASRMKGQRSHTVPLSDGALDVLHKAERLTDGTGLLFPNTKGGEIHGAALSKVLKGLGVTATIHGARSTFRDWAAEQAVDRVLAEQCLAHRLGSETELAYRRSDLVEQRRTLMQAVERRGRRRGAVLA